ncbi:MAG: zinc-dependent alcohol dehydrogenase family protein [Acidimicrobiia bacterium]|nr:zinc-dependent alcohol dehydrogenase family protein [Acidimicrobiia bacterium]
MTRITRVAELDQPAPAADGPLRLVGRPIPGPSHNEVLIAVNACGVCRTDLQLAEGDLELHLHPIVPGHQIVGEVIAAGAGANRSIGSRVGLTWLASTCGRCGFCRSGRENLCPGARFTGWDRDGGFAEAVVADSRFVVPVPDDMNDVDVAPLLCGGVIGHRALRSTGLTTGQRLGLYGFGASATIVLQLALHQGLDVHVATRSPLDQERALTLGAQSIGPYHEPPPQPLDAAISFAPVGSVVIDALRAVDRGGSVVVNAIHLDGIPAFDYGLLWHERSIKSVANVTRRDAVELLELAERIPLVTHHQQYRLEDANQALADLASGQVSGAAVLVPSDR